MERQYAALEAPVHELGTGEEDVLLNPGPLQLGNGTLYVFDYGDFRLKAFDAVSGKARFVFGRSGEGPGEFRNPTQISIRSGATDVWVVDGGLGRVAVLSDDQLQRTLRLPSVEGGIVNLIRLRSRTLVTLFSSENRLWAEVDSGFAPSGFQPFPTPGLATATPNHRQSATAVDSEGKQWAAAFVFTNTFAVYRDTTRACLGTSPTGVPAEEIPDAPIPKFWLGGIAFADSLVLTLGRSAERDRLDVVDLYRASDCGYVASVALPAPARGLAASGNQFAVEFLEPVPRVVIYRVPHVR